MIVRGFLPIGQIDLRGGHIAAVHGGLGRGHELVDIGDAPVDAVGGLRRRRREEQQADHQSQDEMRWFLSILGGQGDFSSSGRTWGCALALQTVLSFFFETIRLFVCPVNLIYFINY
jgi:hypothetical protein